MKLHLFCLKFLFIISLLYPIVTYAQPANDLCDQAIEIVDIENFCSNAGSFSNENATPSNFNGGGELSVNGRDVWFRFTAVASHVSITVRGLGTGGTLVNPEVQLLADNDCGNEFRVLDSETSGFSDIAELNKGGLTPGGSFLFRVQGANGTEGTFQICINNFFPPQTPGSDLDIASFLCDKSPFVVEEIGGAGLDDNEADDTCLDIGGFIGDFLGEPTEQSSTWFTWIAANDGTLEFTLDPLNPLDDIDFVLFELPNGINNGDGKIVLRCMATACLGPTGLNATSTDLQEDANCDPGEDGFVRAIEMQTGRAYGLLINNFTESGNGFSIEFGGTGAFQTPTAIITPTASDQVCLGTEVSFDASSSIGDIVSYEWIFGVGAVPATGMGVNSGPVSYDVPGEKIVVLTITSDLGCKVTEVIESIVTVNACCLDIAIISDTNEIFLGENADLSSDVSMANGNVTYQWLPSDVLSCTDCPNPTITPTEDVIVTLTVTDSLGCEAMDTLEITVKAPCLLDVVITSDFMEIIEGESADLNTNISDANGAVIYQWLPSDILSCTDCPNPTITPNENVIVTLTVTDSIGCEAMDTLEVAVILDDCFLDVVINSDATEIFIGESIDLNIEVSDATGEVTYQWIPDDILSCIDCSNPTITPTEDVIVTLTVTDALGCEAMDNIALEVKLDSCDFEVAITSVSTEVLIGEAIDLEAIVSDETGEVTYEWLPNNVLSCSDSNCLNQSIVTKEDVTVFVTAKDSQDCEARDSFTITVKGILEEITIPNAFTPDNDGTNDIFKILGFGNEQILSFKIYSRWGNLVYELEEERCIIDNHGWNGNYKNGTERMNPDVYIYHAVVEKDQQELTYTGDVTLIR